MGVPYKKISAAEFKKLTSSGGTVEVIDVREPVEFQSETLAGARNVPLSGLEKNAGEVAREKTVYLLCRSGNRAGQAADKLGKLGYENIVVVDGGLEECKRQGLAVSIGSSKVWALDRQVRFAAGLLVVTGLVLSWLVHPGFVGLSLFVGAGLMFSGATNTCGMAMILAKMPWNQETRSCSIKK